MARRPVSVYQLNQYIKRTLEQDPLLIDVVVEGEVSRVTFQRNGYVYFDLKDERSSINCAVWRDLPNKEELATGSHITVYGRLSVYDVRGTYTIAVNAFEVAGEGDLAIAFAQRKKKLEQEGLFDQAHKMPLPVFPKNVAVVTASTGAAIRDILRILTDRNDYVDIYIFPVAVQGPYAPAEIAAAIDRIDRDYPEMDVLIIGRGGGSEEDLMAFNEEIVARSIYRCRIPTISAVGHESDISISDFVADVRAATPTDAANLAVPDMHDVRAALEAQGEALSTAMEEHLRRGEDRLAACSMPLLKQILTTRIEGHEAALAGYKERIEALHPEKTLARGYAMVKNEEGTLVGSAAKLEKGQTAQLLFYDGSAQVKVEDLTANNRTQQIDRKDEA